MVPGTDELHCPESKPLWVLVIQFVSWLSSNSGTQDSPSDPQTCEVLQMHEMLSVHSLQSTSTADALPLSGHIIPNRNPHNTHVFTARILALVGDPAYLCTC